MQRIPTLGSQGEGWVVVQAVLLAGIGVAGLLALPSPAWAGPARLVTSLAGAVLLLLGAAQAFRGVRDLGDNLTPWPHPTPDASLVEHGIYRRVRHPIYGGLILGGVGWALLTTSAIAIVMATVLVPFFWIKSSIEERWLEERFPAYPVYRGRTRRFIAWPG